MVINVACYGVILTSLGGCSASIPNYRLKNYLRSIPKLISVDGRKLSLVSVVEAKRK